MPPFKWFRSPVPHLDTPLYKVGCMTPTVKHTQLHTNKHTPLIQALHHLPPSLFLFCCYFYSKQRNFLTQISFVLYSFLNNTTPKNCFPAQHTKKLHTITLIFIIIILKERISLYFLYKNNKWIYNRSIIVLYLQNPFVYI